MMTKEELAQALNGCEYRNEISKDLARDAKNAGLVVVFGASDDLIEFRGAIYDEVGAYDGGEALITSSGLLDECTRARVIEAIWNDTEAPCWSYETDIPHATFDVMEDDEIHCRGIVFSLSDVTEPV
jgi:hypothetical protein